MCNILQMPTELLHQICSYVSLGDLKHTRSACKRLAHVGGEILFFEIEVILTLASLERLEAISLHPVLCWHVKSLIYTPDRLDVFDDTSFDGWKAELHDHAYVMSQSDEERSQVGPRHKWSEAEVMKGWETYRKLRDEQHTIVTQRLHLAYFARSVVRFPCLRSIKVSTFEGDDARSAYATRTFKAALARSLPYNMVSSWKAKLSDSQELWTVLGPFAQASSDETVTKISQPDESRGEYQVSKLISLSATVPWMAVNQLREMTETFPGLFSQLRDLQLSLNFYDPGHFPGKEVKASVGLWSKLLKAVLIAAPNLTCLAIELRAHFASALAYADLHYFLDSVKLSYIETVSFADFRFSQRDIVNFIECHRSTLKRVVLKDLYLTKGETWIGLADLLRNLKTNVSVRFEGWLWINCGRIEDGLGTWDCFWDIEGDLFAYERGQRTSPTDLIERYIHGDSDFNPMNGAYLGLCGKTCWPLGERSWWPQQVPTSDEISSDA